MGPRTVVTIYPECIRPRVPLPAKPRLRPALEFNSNDLAHALFFTGRAITRANLRAPRLFGWPFGVRRAVRRLNPTADRSLSRQLQHDLKSRLNRVRAHVEPRPSQGGKGNDLMLTTHGQSLTDTAQANLSEDLGLAMMGMYCYETLNVVQLLGISLAKEFLHVVFRPLPAGKKRDRRPDVIGFDVDRNAIIAEAKGRRENPRLPALAAVVDDKLRSVVAVWVPDLLHRGFGLCRLHHRIGCIASFESRHGPLRLHVLDDRCWAAPVPAGPEPLDANLRSPLVYLYYRHVCSAVGDAQITRRDSGSDAGSYRTVELPGITFGVLDSIYELVDETGWNAPDDPDLLGFAGEVDSILTSLDLRDRDSRDQGMFRDGTFFRADWNFELEDAKPPDRRGR